MANALKFALVLQAAILFLASMCLDGGNILHACSFAFVAFWAGFAVLCVRCKDGFSDMDLLLIRGGYVPLCLISFFLTRWIWHLRGYDPL